MGHPPGTLTRENPGAQPTASAPLLRALVRVALRAAWLIHSNANAGKEDWLGSQVACLLHGYL